MHRFRVPFLFDLTYKHITISGSVLGERKTFDFSYLILPPKNENSTKCIQYKMGINVSNKKKRRKFTTYWRAMNVYGKSNVQAPEANV